MTEYRIQMPDGLRLRTTTKRRYIVAAYLASEQRWKVWARSDSEGTILARWRGYCRSHSSVPLHVVDAREGRVIR